MYIAVQFKLAPHTMFLKGLNPSNPRPITSWSSDAVLSNACLMKGSPSIPVNSHKRGESIKSVVQLDHDPGAWCNSFSMPGVERIPQSQSLKSWNTCF